MFSTERPYTKLSLVPIPHFVRFQCTDNNSSLEKYVGIGNNKYDSWRKSKFRIYCRASCTPCAGHNFLVVVYINATPNLHRRRNGVGRRRCAGSSRSSFSLCLLIVEFVSRVLLCCSAVLWRRLICVVRSAFRLFCCFAVSIFDFVG